MLPKNLVVPSNIVIRDRYDLIYIHSPERFSKKMSMKQREEAFVFIKNNALDWAIGYQNSEDIDQVNILEAVKRSWHQCLNGLRHPFNSILVDGKHFDPYKDIKHECIIKGDDTFLSIAAASILAKVEHDHYIHDLVKK
jgi:ribonuclease HII